MPDVSVILPCRNEEKTIGECIRQIKSVFKKEKLRGEIIVSDSSSDNSPKIAKSLGAALVKHNKKGYGIAILEALKIAKGNLIVIADADGTYDFSEMPLFFKKLEQGAELVIGSRLKGRIHKGAMPFLHRQVGNPLLSSTLNLFFGTKLSDAHSGFRAAKKEALAKLELKTTGMEFASEMIIKAAKENLKIVEVPISYRPRRGLSKLKPFSDGWRHLRFMLMFSPTYLFLIPGTLLLFAGLASLAEMVVFQRERNLYMPLFGALSSILGYQVASLGLYSRIYAIHTGFEKKDRLIDIIAENMPLEKGILLGIAILMTGVLGFIMSIYNVGLSGLPGVFLALTLFTIGAQTIFSVFFISIMLVEKTS